MLRRKRRRDASDSGQGGWHISRRRNNDNSVFHNEYRQDTTPLFAPPRVETAAAKSVDWRRKPAPFSGERRSLEIEDDSPHDACYQRLQCLLIVATVGACVLIYLPILMYEIKGSVSNRRFYAPSHPASHQSMFSMSVFKNVCGCLYIAFVALLVFYFFSRTDR